MPPKSRVKFPCGTCSKSANSNALLCNFCDMWHHATVECIPWHSKETINTLMDICKEQSCWTCQKCTGIMKKMNGRLAALEKNVKEVKVNVDAIQAQQEATDVEVKDVKKGISEIRESIAENSSTVSSTVLSEMKDREDRKHNIIVNGMNESSATEKEDVIAEENNILRKLFDKMEIDAKATSENIKFKTRLGTKEPGKQRAFLVKFHDVRVRDDVLRNGKKVSESGVRIKPDLTKIEREEDVKFRKMIDEENENDPKDDSGDYRWKIAGPPGNLRKVKVRDIKEWEEAQRKRKAAQVKK